MRREHKDQTQLGCTTQEVYNATSSSSPQGEFGADSDFELCSDAVLVIDRETNAILEANPAACSIYGYAREEILGSNWDLIQPPGGCSWSQLPEASDSASLTSREVAHRHKNGSSLPMQSRTTPIMFGCRRAILSTNHDVSARHKMTVVKPPSGVGSSKSPNTAARNEAEARLSEKEEQFRLTVDAAEVGVWSWGICDETSLLSPSLKKQLGYDDHEMGEFYGEWESRLHPDDKEGAVARLWAFRENPGPLYESEFRLRCKDRSYRWFLSRGAAVIGDDDQVVRLIGVQIDITDRKLAEKKLRDSEERFRHLVEATRVVPWEAAPATWSMTYVAPQIELMFGYPCRDWLQPNFWLNHLHPDDRDRSIEFCQSQTTDGLGHEIECRFRHADGRYLWINNYVSMRTGPDGAPSKLVGVFVNVTAIHDAKFLIRQYEAELANSWRVNTLSGLVGELAHEINQPLAAVVNNAEYAMRLLGRDENQAVVVRAVLRDISQSGLSAGKIVHRIQEHIRPDAKEVSQEQPEELVKNVLSLMESQFTHEGVRIEFEFEAFLPVISIDRIQIEQVLLNLLTNARNAVHGAPEDRRYIRLSVRRSENFIYFAVANSGGGLSDQYCKQVFEPFLNTSKNALGLGLSICRSMIAEHGGTIWADSTHDETFFRFTLPVEIGE